MNAYDLQHYQTLGDVQKNIDTLQDEFRNGAGKAGYFLALVFAEGNVIIPDHVKAIIGSSDQKALEYYSKSFNLLKEAAEAGDGECMHLVASYYQDGTAPVIRDLEMFKTWTEKAFQAGYFGAIDNLIALYGDPTSQFYDPEKARQLTKQL